MDTVILIQARSGSSRLPGKVLKSVFRNTTMVEWVYNACSDTGIETVVIIPEDDEKLASHLKNKRIKFMCGDENDVLFRYYECAKKLGAKFVIRVTADCPLVYQGDILWANHLLHSQCYDYVTNIDVDGEDVEGFTFDLLKKCFKNCDSDEEMEHVTTGMKRYADKIAMIKKLKNIRSVNTKEDLEIVRKELGRIHG